MVFVLTHRVIWLLFSLLPHSICCRLSRDWAAANLNYFATDNDDDDDDEDAGAGAGAGADANVRSQPL